MKRLIAFLCALILLTAPSAAFPVFSSAQQDVRVITNDCAITLGDKEIDKRLTDDDEKTFLKYNNGCVIKVQSEEKIGAVYIKFDRTPPVWTLSYGEKTVACGRNGFLHEYEKLENAENELTLTFSGQVSIADLFILSTGEVLPSFVQVWRAAEGNCDVMLLACHSDDDQLFFAGSVPDAVARGAEMQVCYFTNHWNTHTRPHELLNGLWTCGLDRYPVVGEYPDTKKALNEEEGLKIFEDLGYTFDDMVRSQTLLLRRFKPQIVLVHDIEGEYGHSAHRLDSHSLREAASLSGDPTAYPDMAEEYGVWDVPKIYIHLYEKNTIDFEIDKPLSLFGGRTAYQVSQDAFRCHISQFNSRYRDWLIGTEEKPVTKGSEFPLYSPRSYGLWRSLVGADEQKTDFYEHIVFYADKDKEPDPSSAAAPPENTPTPGQTDPPDDPKAEPAFKPADAVMTILVCAVVLCAAALLIKNRKKRS